MSRSLAGWLSALEAAHPLQIDMGLERVRVVARRLELDRADCPVITVAGTNGKGSCVATAERLLLASGKRTGVYTSPHLRRYNERVRLDGVEVSDETLCRAFEVVEEARQGTSLTYFEHGTLAALQIFREARPDRLVLEVGLGGRLDAVNIVDPAVAVVTSIGLDHQDWLGPDRESIAREKAGIFRRGVPAVIGDRDPPEALAMACRATGARWYAIGDHFDECLSPEGAWRWRGEAADGSSVRESDLPAPALMGSNVACAMQALALCGDLPERGILERVLPTLVLEGRMQRFRHAGVECILDVAHNPDGVASLVRRLGRAERRSVVVMGAMRDKDCAGIISALVPVVDVWFLATLPGPRAADAATLAGLLPDGAIRQCHAGVDDALLAAFEMLAPWDRLLVCGSFHAVGPALDWFDLQRERA